MVAKQLAGASAMSCLHWMRTTNQICAACDDGPRNRGCDFAPAPDATDFDFGCCCSRIDETDDGPRPRGCDFAPAPHAPDFDLGCCCTEKEATLTPWLPQPRTREQMQTMPQQMPATSTGR